MISNVLIWSIVISALGYSIIPTYVYRILQHCNKTKKNKTIYLTFDDGPDSHYTNHLLDLLRQYNIKASFFVVASFAKENPQIITRMKQEGHLIGLHSLEHKNPLCQTPSSTKNDFIKSIQIMYDLSVNTHYFRPPWGSFNASTISQIKSHEFHPVLWDVMAQDWRGNTTSKEIIEKLIHRTKGGDIICLHDGRGKNEAPSRTIEALKIVLPYWISLGYHFETVDKYDK